MKQQPIKVMTVVIDDDAFWNWLADEVQIDLSGMEFVGGQEGGAGDIELVVRRRERTFREVMTPEDAERLKEDEEDGRFHRQG